MPASQQELLSALNELGRDFAPDDRKFIGDYMRTPGSSMNPDMVKRWEKLSSQYGWERVAQYGAFHNQYNQAVNDGNWGNELLQGMYGRASTSIEKMRQAAKEQSAADAVTAERKKVGSQLQRLFEMLNAPVINPDGTTSDPIAKQLVATGTNVAQGEATRRGIGGPAAGTAAMTSAQTSLAPYLQHRLDLAGQVASVINQRDLALEDQRLKADQLSLSALAMDNAAKGERWSALQNQAQAMFGAVGGIAGGAVGGYLGGPQGAAAGYQAGSSFLGGIGGAVQGGSGPNLGSPSFTNTSNPGYTGRGGF